MKLISTLNVGSGGAANITFSNIPQNFTDLQISFSGRTANTSSPGDGPYVLIRFNGLFVGGYSERILMGSGSGVSTQSFTTNDGFLLKTMITPGNAAANLFSSSQIYISNYSASVGKNISSEGISENNSSIAYQTMQSSFWSNSAAISSITISVYDGGVPNLAQNTTASLYGITKGSGGATVS